MANQVLERTQCKALIYGSIVPGKIQYISPFSNLSWFDGWGGVELAIPGTAVKYFTNEPNPLTATVMSVLIIYYSVIPGLFRPTSVAGRSGAD